METMTDIKIETETATYLQMIQSAIDRMSTASAIFKGFSATIVASISAMTFCQIITPILCLLFVPILAFLALDIYYLSLERRFRFLYEQVRTGSKATDYCMSPPRTKEIKDFCKANQKKTNVGLFSCLSSMSIWLFYAPVVAIATVVIILRIVGVL